MVEFVAMADLHAHNHRLFAKVDERGMNSRLQTAVDVIEEVRSFCRSQEVHDVIIIGDLFHLRGLLQVDVMDAIRKAILRLVDDDWTQVFILAGNHDQAKKNRQDLVSITAVDGIPNVHIICEPMVYGNYVFVPYSEDKERTCQFVQENAGKDHVLFAHLGVDTAITGPNDFVMHEPYTMKDLCATKYQHIFLGHYHKHQKLGKNGWYVGSPYQMDFGEAGEEKGFMAVCGDAVKFVPTHAPEFVKIGPTEYLHEGHRPQNYYRVERYEPCEEGEQKNIDWLRSKPNIEVIIIPKTEERNERSEITLAMSDADILRKYIEESGGGDPQGKILKTGMDILQEVAR